MESPLLTAEDLITQGNKAMLRKDWQEAVRLYALLREKFPEQPDGYVGGAAALRALGDFESVDALMLEGLKKFPKDAALYVKYGDSAMRRKDWPEAAKRWALMRKKCPRKPHGYFKGAAALKEQGNFDAADALVLEGLEKFPAEPCLHIEYGEVATRQKKWAEAARRWALMREKCPENPRGYVSGVEALKESRNFESADALALEGLEKFPQEPELYIQYGDMAARKKDFPEASRRWALMREKCPRHPRGYTSGVAVLKIQGEFKAAEDLVLAGLKKFPKEPGLYIQYGDIAMRRKNWPEASRRWALMREKCPRHPRGYTDGAKSLAEQEEFEAAD
ncbi:MAG: tetratricopeptide repeat protein, partial [Deltaproteobacteria bacterium]|nr:tetratricopeptide repeat protein [Deltaproteobacteria bacterium]